MKVRYPRRVTLYNRQKQTQVFEFKTINEEKEITDTGNWIENPSEWNDPTPEVTDEQEEEAENIPDTIIHKPETPKEPVLEIKSFVCKTCGFKGKNAQSLSTHQRHTGHGDR